ncbi:MAG TPA: PEP-CTERM sorting domain-containing protein [Acidobacteriaceae bacterium]|nr:PEP-CTERM sorting domain-containing protein [Acidobacteriaceae bacterium]
MCTSTTLNVYTNNDANNYSCTLDGLTFSNFSYTASNGLPAESTVQVTPVSDSSGDVGFIFQGAWTAGAGLSSDAVLVYNIMSSNGAMALTGDSVTLLSYGARGSGASATIVEGVCTTARQSNGSCVPASDAYSLTVYDNANNPPPVPSDAVVFTTATNTVQVNKNIVEVGGSGSATISQFENLVQTNGGQGGPGGSGVPEPASLFTVGSGILGACMLLRKKVRKLTR